MTDHETYSLREIERDYRVHRNTLRRAINEGRLRATRSNDGNWIILPEDLSAYMRDRQPVAGGRPPQITPEQPPAPQINPVVAELAADEHWLAERLEKLTDNLRQVEAENASLRQHNAILAERDKAAIAVMLEVRELMEIQSQRIGDLKNDKAQVMALLKQAHDRLMDVDGERKQLFDRLLAIIDVNIPDVPETSDTVRRDRH